MNIELELGDPAVAGVNGTTPNEGVGAAAGLGARRRPAFDMSRSVVCAVEAARSTGLAMTLLCCSPGRLRGLAAGGCGSLPGEVNMYEAS